ncbi:putative mucin TcMUCII [Trypanosoma cruzi]|uniref:Mucin TcMUCII, putative n=2 Tax=Trypanosoma cruzi TaxID=5693 RepID=Q4DN21_TRYCC|nr:mucin TcMUCII, putative [Trypanosoma cruzi]EAN93919.1 mucin TcMUCII, putative [Trypanosoma cruzi]PWV20982.1 putative mucin TcMUCII [Trypanosoma cruzi]|eukprot:XP_815770.1 mucin TcMUCII [Trypanosoma cruzi strain CL Brener]
MMTCRLLCALLLLALCCCPSVCVMATVDVKENDSGEVRTPDETLPGNTSLNPNAPTVPKAGTSKDTEKTQDLPTGGSSTGKDALGASGQTQLQSPGVPLQPTTAPTVASVAQIVPIRSETVQEKGATPSTTTTTTTTKAPTTTTTTTEAPTTTTTEAPAVSTTRAPSRLREIDGSLSSSAWVCAPLVLAASALAYTAVG